MASSLKTAQFGQLLHFLSRGKLFPYPEERSDFVLPEKYGGSSSTTARSMSDATVINDSEKEHGEPQKEIEDAHVNEGKGSEHGIVSGQDIERQVSAAPSALQGGDALTRAISGNRSIQIPTKENEDKDLILVDWYGENDPENPQNWSFRKKVLVTLLISQMTFGVYAGSAIYTPAIEGVMEEFNVGLTKAILGLSLFVFGYGIGPLFLSPLSEVPIIGRNWTYIPSMMIFVLFNVGAADAPNYSTLMAFRFFTGFFGSPALATGGASLGDIWSQLSLPFPIAIWAIGAVCGPVLGPVIGGFSAMNLNWRWPLWLLVIASGLSTSLIFLLLPETYAPTILLHRARRLRKLTGNDKIKSQGEIDQANLTATQLLEEALARPFILAFEPVVFYTSLYLGIAYACFYLFFEAFPIVYLQFYHFNLGESGLPYLGLAVTGVLTMAFYLWYLEKVFNPRFLAKASKGIIIPEDRLAIALFASIFVPISMFGFGWLSRPSIHWIVPTIFASLLLPGVFLLFQSILVYLPMSYPQHAASVLAANDMIRSLIAGAFPLFGHALFTNLGNESVGKGSSVVGGIFIALIPPLWALKRYGHHLRRWSKYAHVY